MSDLEKHTPGPWSYKPTSGFDYGSTIYWVPGICTHVGKEADARLIAAAPELLDALVTLCKLALSGEPVIFTAEYDKARTAIVKATEGIA